MAGHENGGRPSSCECYPLCPRVRACTWSANAQTAKTYGLTKRNAWVFDLVESVESGKYRRGKAGKNDVACPFMFHTRSQAVIRHLRNAGISYSCAVHAELFPSNELRGGSCGASCVSLFGRGVLWGTQVCPCIIELRGRVPRLELKVSWTHEYNRRTEGEGVYRYSR